MLKNARVCFTNLPYEHVKLPKEHLNLPKSAFAYKSTHIFRLPTHPPQTCLCLFYKNIYGLFTLSISNSPISLTYLHFDLPSAGSNMMVGAGSTDFGRAVPLTAVTATLIKKASSELNTSSGLTSIALRASVMSYL